MKHSDKFSVSCVKLLQHSSLSFYAKQIHLIYIFFCVNINAKAGEKMSISNDNKFSADNILSHLHFDTDVRFFDSIDSTNNEAKRNSESLSDKPVLFVANHQHSGRGRLGRTFYSPKNTGLYMSLMLKNNKDAQNIVSITTATAVCVCDAIKELCDIEPKIKWVNDIYIENKKVCGILCEAVTNPYEGTIDGIIIGIGVNISTTDFPAEITDIATSLRCNIDKAHLCALITDKILSMYQDFKNNSFIDKYKSYSMVLGKEITYIENNIPKTATAIDVDPNGGLVIKTDDGLKTLSTGEITIRVIKA